MDRGGRNIFEKKLPSSRYRNEDFISQEESVSHLLPERSAVFFSQSPASELKSSAAHLSSLTVSSISSAAFPMRCLRSLRCSLYLS